MICKDINYNYLVMNNFWNLNLSFNVFLYFLYCLYGLKWLWLVIYLDKRLIKNEIEID